MYSVMSSDINDLSMYLTVGTCSNGRIPPLPKGYSTALSGVIKAMLNLNVRSPMELETEPQYTNSPPCVPLQLNYFNTNALNLYTRSLKQRKCMLNVAFPLTLHSSLTLRLSVVKIHKSTVINREREVIARETALREQEQQLASILSSKENEIVALQHMVAQLEQQHRQQYSQQDVELAIKEAVARREEELRILVTKRETEVAEAMARREEEIMKAVRKREAEIFEEWRAREASMQQEMEEQIKGFEDRVEWIQAKEQGLMAEDARLETVRTELEDKILKVEQDAAKSQSGFTSSLLL